MHPAIGSATDPLRWRGVRKLWSIAYRDSAREYGQ